MSGLTIPSESARRYASALFELALDAQSVDTLASDMKAVGNAVSGFPDLARALRSPVVSNLEKAGVLKSLGEQAGLSAMAQNFLGLVAQNGRARELGLMARAFEDLVAEHKGLLTADVASATPLSDAQTRNIAAALKSAYGREVDVRAEVRPELLGGLVVKVGSRMFDSSVKTKLAGLASAMKG